MQILLHPHQLYAPGWKKMIFRFNHTHDDEDLRPLATDVYFENYYQTLSCMKSAFLLLRSDYNVLSSMEIALNNFSQYSHCQVVQLFRLIPIQQKPSPSSQPNTYALALGFRLRSPLIYQDESSIFCKVILLKLLFL